MVLVPLQQDRRTYPRNPFSFSRPLHYWVLGFPVRIVKGARVLEGFDSLLFGGAPVSASRTGSYGSPRIVARWEPLAKIPALKPAESD